jgi:histidyl-tRNA synthetase
MDLNGRSLKAQMKAAGRQDAAWVVVRGDAELESGQVQLKDMATGEQRGVAVSDLAATLTNRVP